MTQTAAVLKRLKEGPVTPLEALRDMGIMRLAARVNDLRDAGFNIETDIIEKGGKRFAQYRLAK